MGFACVRCGQSLPTEAKFCLQCGTSVEGLPPRGQSGEVFRALEGPSVGRDDERTRVGACWSDVCRTGQERVLAVVGESGVGKSRLVADALEVLGATAVTVRCTAAGEALGLGPLAELVLSLCDAVPATDTSVLTSRLDQILGAPDPLVARLLGHVGLGPALGPVDELPGDLGLVLRAVARRTPFALVVEDLDDATLRLRSVLEAAIGTCADVPLLVVVTAAQRHAVSSLGPDDVVQLERLTSTQVAELLVKALGGSPVVEELVVPVARAAEGSPFLLEQLLALLVDSSALRPVGEGWELVDAPSELPSGLDAVLAERLGQLPEAERRVLECAAVLGIDMGLGELLALSAGGPDPSAALDCLVERHLLLPTGEGHAYRFHHAAVRDAAYRATPRRRLAELHLRAADHFEHMTPFLRERIAVHLERAVALHSYLEPAVLLEPLARRAAHAWHELGAGALLMGEPEGARQCLERGLLVAPAGGGDRPSLLQGLAEALLDLGEVEHAVRLSQEAGALGEQSGDEAVRLRAELSRLRGEAIAGTTSARDVVAPMRASATRLEARREWVRTPRAWLTVARTARDACDWEAAAAAATRAVRRARETASPDLGASLALACSVAALGPQPLPEAHGLCAQARAQVAPGTVAAALCTAYTAWVAALDGRGEEAYELAGQALAVSRWRGVPAALGDTLLVVGQVAHAEGRWADAAAAFVEARTVLRAAGLPAGTAAAYEALARFRAGDVAGSREALAGAAEAAGAAGSADSATLVLSQLVEQVAVRLTESLLLRSGDPVAAVTAAHQAVQLAERTRVPVLMGDASYVLSEALAHVEAAGDARDALEAAREHYLAKGAHAPLAQLALRSATL